jgi:SAM-dependent methyltransferase
MLDHVSNIDSILDIGCGYGAFLYNLHQLNPNIKLSGIDISKEAIEFCRKNLPNSSFINDKFSNILKHFKENTYDVIYTSGVMIHQSPDIIDDLLDSFIKIGTKYIVHFEDIGNDELISGKKEYNPSWRESDQFLWKNNLVKRYQEKGCSFTFQSNVPKELRGIGFTNYMVVDLQNSFFDKQDNKELDNIYTTKEKLWEN